MECLYSMCLVPPPPSSYRTSILFVPRPSLLVFPTCLRCVIHLFRLSIVLPVSDFFLWSFFFISDPWWSLDLPPVSVDVSFFDRSDVFGPAPVLTSSCSQAHRDLLFPYCPAVKSFSPIGVSPIVFPLFSHFESCHTCLESCVVLGLTIILTSFRGISLHNVNGNSLPCSLTIVVFFVVISMVSSLVAASDLLLFSSRFCLAALCFCCEIVRPCLAALCLCREVLRVVIIFCIVIVPVLHPFILHLSSSDLLHYSLSLLPQLQLQLLVDSLLFSPLFPPIRLSFDLDILLPIVDCVP